MESMGNVNVRRESVVGAPSEGSRAYLYLVVLVATVGGFLYGYDSLIMSGALIFIEKDFKLTSSQLGFAVGSITIGSLIGSLIASWFSDHLGRKKTMIVAAILFLLSAIGTGYPPNVTVFNAFRLLGGLGMGIAMVVSPVYIAEVSPARIRGRLVTFNQFIIVFGSIIAFLISARLAANENWRAMMLSVIIPVLVLLIGLIFVPESPRWLVSRGRRDQARNILAKINGPSRAETEVNEIEAAVQEEHRQESGNWSELFSPGIRTALYIAVGLGIIQQFSGGYPLTMYAPKIFMDAGFPDPQKAIKVAVLIQCWSLVCVVIAMWLIERLGRRPLLLFGIFMMAVGELVLYFAFRNGWTGKSVPLVLILTTGMSNISISPLAWVILAEIFPTRIRGKGMAVATFFLFVASYIIVQIFPVMEDFFEKRNGTPAGVFLSLSVFCFLSVLWMWRTVPETKGKTLEQLSEFWLRKRSHRLR